MEENSLITGISPAQLLRKLDGVDSVSIFAYG